MIHSLNVKIPRAEMMRPMVEILTHGLVSLKNIFTSPFQDRYCE